MSAQIKERPILFSGAMVRALLDGSKTQTRRALRDQVCSPAIMQMAGPGYAEIVNEHGVHIPGFTCPYGQPGDRLWVRETWLEDPEDDGTWHYTQYMGCKGSPLSDIPRKFQKPEHCIYREGWDGSDLRWRPSIHMPRWASRILLEVVSVRVERLQGISDDDCRAEGISQCDGIASAAHMIDLAGRMGGAPSIEALTYAALWEAINGLGSWDANPWVWVVEFKRATP